MDLFTWIIFMYIAGTIIVGWFLFHDGGPAAPLKRDSLMAPGYKPMHNSCIEDSVVEKSKVDGAEREDSRSYSARVATTSGANV